MCEFYRRLIFLSFLVVYHLCAKVLNMIFQLLKPIFAFGCCHIPPWFIRLHPYVSWLEYLIVNCLLQIHSILFIIFYGSLSALSLLIIPVWLGIHIIFMSKTTFLHWFSKLLMFRVIVSCYLEHPSLHIMGMASLQPINNTNFLPMSSSGIAMVRILTVYWNTYRFHCRIYRTIILSNPISTVFCLHNCRSRPWWAIAFCFEESTNFIIYWGL